MAGKGQGIKTDVAYLYSTISRNLQNPDGLETVEKLDPNPGDYVLDLGCGTGYLSSILAGKVGTQGRVLAVDPDLERIKVAKTEYSDVTNLSFSVGNSDVFPDVGNCCYDAVFSNYVIHWIADKEKVFRRVYDSLRPHGNLTFRYITSDPLIEEAIRVLKPEFLPTFYNILFFEPEMAVNGYCHKSGFKVIQSYEYLTTRIFESIDDYLKFCTATLHGLIDLSSVAEDRMKEFHPPLDDQGRVLFQYGSAIVVAVKESEDINNAN